MATTPSPTKSQNYPPPNYGIPATFSRNITDVPVSQHKTYEGCLSCCGNMAGCLGAYIPCCFCCMNPFKTVPQGHVGLISKFGKVYKVVDPGLHFINSFTEKLCLCNVAITISDIPRQVVMTHDNVTVSIDSVIYWHIVDPFVAMFQVQDIEKALMERTMTTLKETVGALDLQSIIANREAIATDIRGIIESIANSWGVEVEAILIKDLQFSHDLQESLSSAAKQKRIGESKVIAAKAEVDAAKLMREASDILNTPAAMQIRYLDTLTSMSKAAGTKVIFMPLSHHQDAVQEVAEKLVVEKV